MVRGFLNFVTNNPNKDEQVFLFWEAFCLQLAQEIIERYQTSSPSTLAIKIGIAVIYKELPNLVRGFYVPKIVRDGIIVINANLSRLRQDFALCYIMCKHIEGHFPYILAPETASELELATVMFALDILTTNRHLDTSEITDTLIKSGAPADVMNPLYISVEAARNHIAIA